jgi:hypothetical protein
MGRLLFRYMALLWPCAAIVSCQDILLPQGLYEAAVARPRTPVLDALQIRVPRLARRSSGLHEPDRQLNPKTALMALWAQRTFSVANPIIARIRLMIQNRITICGSAQPFFSKWWWIGAIRKIRFLVRL